jgi:DDE superfamily endonuclease
MENILDTYKLPFDKELPVVCMDEKPYQLLDHVLAPLPVQPGNIQKIDAEYKREGNCSIFVFAQPLADYRHVSVRKTRTMLDWAEEIDSLLTVIYPEKEKIILVMDNLNTHTYASLYKRFPPEKARELAKRLEIRYTPIHGSWLNIAEIELNVMTRQCLNRRIPNIHTLSKELTSWEEERNAMKGTVNWHFTAEDARIKLKSLYPKVETPKISRFS